MIIFSKLLINMFFATLVALQSNSTHLTLASPCTDLQTVKIDKGIQIDQFSVMTASYTDTNTLKMSVWFNSDPLKFKPRQWVLNLLSNKLSSSNFYISRPIQQPCMGFCETVVVDRSRNGKWQLVLGKISSNSSLKVWLVSKSQVIKVIDDVRSITKWQWANDSTQFFYLAAEPYGGTYSAGVVNLSNGRSHNLNALFDKSTILDAAFDETRKKIGVVVHSLGSSEIGGNVRIAFLNDRQDLEVESKAEATLIERIDWISAKKTFVTAKGEYGEMSVLLDVEEKKFTTERMSSVEKYLFEGEGRRVLPSPNLNHIVVADATGFRVFTCKQSSQ